jgi:predicted nucleotidyltransferase
MTVRVEEIRAKAVPVLKRFGARRASVFGSVATGESGPTSDVDILVELGSTLSLLDFIALKLELEDLLGREVDLVEYCTLKPELRERVLAQEVSIL